MGEDPIVPYIIVYFLVLVSLHNFCGYLLVLRFGDECIDM